MDYHLRIPANRPENIEKARRLRAEAAALKAKVSDGSYDAEDLNTFRSLVGSAGLILMASNTELGRRAGLADDFFRSVVRDKRAPKLTNFLSALTAIVAVANERLGDSIVSAEPDARISSILTQSNRQDLLLLARSLASVARQEIIRLDAERPNAPEAIKRNEKYRELLARFADGFDRIADAISEIAEKNEEASLKKTAAIVKSVSDQISRWWDENSVELVDCTIRLPILTAGVGALNLVGADMHIGTAAVAALVGGEKVVAAIRKGSKRRKT